VERAPVTFIGHAGRVAHGAVPLMPETKTTTATRTAAATAAERRRERRARLTMPARVRPSDPKDGDFDEVCLTINASRGGLFFLSDRDDYEQGLRVFLTFPHSELPDPFSSNYLAEVVRVERKANGKLGVALRILTGVNLQPGSSFGGPSRK
jgi:hypothetical protein